MVTSALRQELGDFSSILCFKALITGMEDALGEKATSIAVIAAGRTRGKCLAQELDLVNSKDSFDEVAQKMNLALGKEGTRLCVIEKIFPEGDAIKVYTSETLCSAGEAQGSSRKSTYTLGAVWGVLEKILGKRLRGVHTESVLQGGNYDVFEFTSI